MNQDFDKRELKRQLPLELARRLQDKSPQFGKTVFMKLVYLLQELYGVPLGYRFSLYTYGPYSPEVLADLEYAKQRRQVNVEYSGDPKGGFRISTGERADAHVEQSIPTASYEDKLNELVARFGSFNARELELRTTSIFVWNKIRPKNEGDFNKVIQAVFHLKPHFEKNAIRVVINGLVSDKTLEYFTGK